MAYGTTLPAPVRAVMPRSPRAWVAPGQEPRGLRVAVEGQRLRGQRAKVSPPWLPDAPSNRPRTGVWLGLRRDAPAQPCLTWQA